MSQFLGMPVSSRSPSTTGSGRPVVFSTLTNPELHEVICRSDALVLDLFSVFLRPLEQEFQLGSTHAAGRYHGLVNRAHYEGRIEAIDFALSHDDGASIQHYDAADLKEAAVQAGELQRNYGRA